MCKYLFIISFMILFLFLPPQLFSSFKYSNNYVKMPFGNPKLYIFSICGTPNLLFSHIHIDDCIKVSYISCSKPVPKNYHINVRWNTTKLKRASLKCIYQITFANWNGLKEASCHLFIWSLVFFLLMSMGNWVIILSCWIYRSINPLASSYFWFTLLWEETQI